MLQNVENSSLKGGTKHLLGTHANPAGPQSLALIVGASFRDLYKHRHDHDDQFDNDDNFPLLDCRERLSGYRWVMGIDVDEIVLPRKNMSLKAFIKVRKYVLLNFSFLYLFTAKVTYVFYFILGQVGHSCLLSLTFSINTEEQIIHRKVSSL